MQLPSFIFNANTMTPEQLARNRALAEAMLNRGQTGVASNVGEGLAQLGQALGGRLRLSGIDKAMRAGQERAYSGMANAYGGAPAAAPVAASVVSGGAGGGGGGGVPKGKQGFVDMLGPAAIQYGNQIGVDPRIIIAQAAQETGWGRSAPGNNYFGIKSHGKGGGQTFTTHDFINGKRVKMQDSFRSFNSPADSVAGYADFLTSNKRYRPMLGAKGLEAQVAALGQSGYATDPNYGSSIYNIAKGINLDGVQIVPASAPPPGAMPVSEDMSVTQTPLGSQKPMGTAMTGFQQPKVFAPAPGMQPQSPQISTAPASAPPQAPQMARQAPLSAYQRMMATSLGKEAGGLAAPPNRAQMASVMGNAGPARSPFAAPAPMGVEAPQNFAAPSPLTAPAPSAPQQSRSAGLRSFIGSSDFAHLEPAQQQLVIADYNRALEAEQPKAPAYKYFDVGGDQYRVNEADPSAKPELFIDAPSKPGWRPATAEEKQAMGLDPSTPAQMSPEGKVETTTGVAKDKGWREVTLEDGVYAVNTDDPTKRVKIGERPERNEGEGRTFSQETKFRSEYMKESQPFIDLRTNYTRINAASQDQTGASDIALVYSYMKMLDPTSVVREGEFATAENAGGIPQQIQSLYNKAVNGQRLAPEVRADFLKQAKRQYDGQLKTYGSIRKKWQELAVKNGLNPENVAPNINYDEQPAPDSGTKIPAEAIGLLKADPSGEAVREFNEVFGAGAAERILQESANDRK